MVSQRKRHTKKKSDSVTLHILPCFGMQISNYVFNVSPANPASDYCVGRVTDAMSRCMNPTCRNIESAHSTYRCGDCKTTFCSKKCMADEWESEISVHKSVCRLLAPLSTFDYYVLHSPLLSKCKVEGDRTDELCLTGINMDELFSCSDSATPKARQLYQRVKELVQKRNEFLYIAPATSIITLGLMSRRMFSICSESSLHLVYDEHMLTKYHLFPNDEVLSVLSSMTIMEFCNSTDERVTSLKNCELLKQFAKNTIASFDWNPFNMEDVKEIQNQNSQN